LNLLATLESDPDTTIPVLTRIEEDDTRFLQDPLDRQQVRRLNPGNIIRTLGALHGRVANTGLLGERCRRPTHQSTCRPYVRAGYHVGENPIL
jgi:hypothetical protein